jgi:hypothetical protein
MSFYLSALDNIAGIVNEQKTGASTPLEAYGQIKEIEAVVKMAIDQLKPAALEAASDYDESKFEEGDFAFTQKAGARRWNFKMVPEWQEKTAQVKAVEEKYKRVYENAQNGLDTIEGDEVLTVPEINYNAPSLSAKRL